MKARRASNPHNRRLCGAKRVRGGTCVNYADTCPDHKNQSSPPDEQGTYPLRLGSLLAGVEDTGGALLRQNRHDFERVVAVARQRFGLSEESLTRDYHMHQALRGAFSEMPPGSQVMDGDLPVGCIAFGGGTSLVSAHGITERDSEDVDLAFIAGRQLGESKRKRLKRDAFCASARGVAPLLDPTTHKRSSTGYVARGHVTVGDEPDYLKIEVADITPPDSDIAAQLHRATGGPYNFWVPATAQSLMGRAASPETLAAYPELQGFDVAAVSIPYIVTNKFLAMHKRAVEGEHGWLAERGRDLYDLCCVARSPKGVQEARSAIAPLAEHVRRMWPRREKHPRPAAGFSSSPIFAKGSEAQTALKSGYRDSLALVWGGFKPSFEEALEAARSLD